MSGESIRQLPERLAEALPISIISVEQYWGSFLRIGGVTPSGISMHLRLYLCDWEVLLDGKVVATSNADSSRNGEGLRALHGDSIVEILTTDSKQIELVLAGGGRATLVANLDEYDSSDEMLLAYLSAHCVSYSPDFGFNDLPNSPPGQVA